MVFSETDVMSPLFMVTIIGCFMVVLPWSQSRRFARWRAGQPKETAAALYFFDPDKEADFSILDVIGAFCIILLFGIQLMFPQLSPKTDSLITIELLKSGAVLQVVLVSAVLLRLMFTSDGIAGALGLRRGGITTIVFSALAVYLLSVLLSFIFAFAGWPAWVESNFGAKSQQMVEMMSQIVDPELKFWMVLSAVVIAPLAEELVFRGYVFGTLRDLAGPVPAIILSGLFFGLIHVNLQALPILCFLGMGLAVIYHRTRSIWAPILCHFVFNSVSTFVLLSASQA